MAEPKLDAQTRYEIQNSREPATVLAARLGVNRKTISKWRNRQTVEDRPRGRAQERSSTVLTKEEEAIIVGFRMGMLLPLDDCLYALQTKMPFLTRSSLHRCLSRYGVSRLPQMVGGKVPLKGAQIGLILIGFGETVTGDGRRRVLAATDLVSRLFYAESTDYEDDNANVEFLKNLIRAIPYNLHTIIVTTDFMDMFSKRTKNSSSSLFKKFCKSRNFDLIVSRPEPIWSKMQLERLNVLPDSSLYDSAADLDGYLYQFMKNYNFGRQLQALRGRTPCQNLTLQWQKSPALFSRSPVNAVLQRGASQSWDWDGKLF